MPTDLARRVAKLGSRRKSSEAVILDTLPGMRCEEAMRLWFGDDRASWPPNDPACVLVINGLDMTGLLKRQLDDIPHEFMEERSGLLFEIRWNRLCDMFDKYRQQVQNSHGRGLMERVTPAGDYSALYRPVEIPFEAPASVN